MSFRLSPNEQAAVLQQERDRRRKLRIQQVLEQERQFAQKVHQRKAVELNVLSEQLEDGWSKEQDEKANNLRLLYEKNLQHIGEGHRAAAGQKPQEGQRAAAALLNKKAAQGRYNAALDKLRDEQDMKHQKEYAHILSRLTALEIEKSRAAKIASLPAPVKETVEEVKPAPPVKCVEDFSTTHYHGAAEYVEKAEPHEQGDAKAAAVQEEERLKEEHLEIVREEKERKEKAILRHKHAHKRELLDQDMGRLMEELGQMEQADRWRRQAVVAKIPHQVFQPPHRRLVEREEHQVNLEQAFEDMYMANTEYTGDLTLALEPRVPHHDEDLDLTVDDLSSELPGAITLQPTDAVSSHGRDLQDQNGTSGKPLSRKETLQKLMRKIQGQRQDWREKSVQDLSMKPPGPEGIQSLPGDDAKQTRHTDAIQSAPWLTEGSTSTLTSSDGSSRQGRDKTSELSEHPISNGDMNSQGSQEDRLTEEDTMSEPIISGSPSLFHPMELAAKLRSSSKMSDMSQLQKQQHQLMKKDEEHRQRLAQQQLDAHSDQHKHLQVLQRNLEERQQALDRQIKEYGVKRQPTQQREEVSESEQPQQAQVSHLGESEQPQHLMKSHLSDAQPREIHHHSPSEIPGGIVGTTVQGTESGHVMHERIDQTTPQSFSELQGFSVPQNTQGTESGHVMKEQINHKRLQYSLQPDEQQRFSIPQNTQGAESGHVMQEQIGQRTLQSLVQPDEEQGFSIPQPSFATVSNNEINMQSIITTEEASEQNQGSQGTSGYRAHQQSETTESGGIVVHKDDLTNEQITFREFLRAQREKLEVKNKEHQEQLRLKQEQLREQIKRQMEQYRDGSLERYGTVGGDYAAEVATPLILQSPYSDISRPEPPNLPSVVSTGSQDMQVPGSYPARPHHRPPPPSRFVTNPIVEMRPHELSTIIEVDTPRSERQSIGGRPATISNQPAGRQLFYQSSGGFEISQVDVTDQSVLDEDGSKSSQLLSTHSMNDSSFPERSTAIPDSEVALHPASVLREDLLSVLRNDYNRSTTMLESLRIQDQHDFSEVANPFAAKVKEQDYDAHLEARHSMTDTDELAHVTGYENSATSDLDSKDQDLMTADGRRFDTLISLPSLGIPSENIPESTLAAGNYPSADSLIGPDGSSTVKGGLKCSIYGCW